VPLLKVIFNELLITVVWLVKRIWIHMKLWNLTLFAFCYYRKRLRLNYNPFFFWIEPTNHCNLKCLTCPQSMMHTSEKGYMEIGTYRRILEEIEFFSPMMISLHLGGESLLHEDLPQMIRVAKEKNIEVTLASNATLLTKEKSEDIIMAGLDGITVNFSADKEDFEKNYKGAKWEKVCQNIKDFLQIKRKLRKAKPFFSIQILTTNNEIGTIRKNINDLERLFVHSPYDSIMAEPMHNWSGDFADKSVKDLNYKVNKDRNRYFPCSHLWSSMVVRWNGDVVPCCRDLQGGIVLGNVDKRSLADIWNSQELVELRRKHRDFKYHEVSICKNCSKLWEGQKPYHLLFSHISELPLKIKGRSKNWKY